MSLILTASSFLPGIVLHPVDYFCSLCRNSTNRDQLSLQPACHHNICLLARPLQVYGCSTGAVKNGLLLRQRKSHSGNPLDWNTTTRHHWGVIFKFTLKLQPGTFTFQSSIMNTKQWMEQVARRCTMASINADFFCGQFSCSGRYCHDCHESLKGILLCNSSNVIGHL